MAPARSDRNLTVRTVATKKGEGDGSPELQSSSGPPQSLLGRAAVSQLAAWNRRILPGHVS
jgi:hypothetical protein